MTYFVVCQADKSRWMGRIVVAYTVICTSVHSMRPNDRG